jgi:hypothetical protein
VLGELCWRAVGVIGRTSLASAEPAVMGLSGFREHLAARASVLVATEATGLHEPRSVGLSAARAKCGALPRLSLSRVQRPIAGGLREWPLSALGRCSTCRWECR